MSTKFKDGLTSGGTLIAKSDITLGDYSASSGPNGESQGSIILGAGSDLTITTDSDQGVIRQTTASKDMFIQPADSNSILITKSATPENKIAEFIEAGAVKLYHNTALKFSTNSAGIMITGTDTTALGDGNVARNSGTVQAGIFKFDTGSDGGTPPGDANDHARIQTTWLANDSTTLDFIIEDNAADYYRWRKRVGGLNSNNLYSEMTLKSTAAGDVTLKVGGGFDKDASAAVDMTKGTVDADIFTGQAATVATISGFDTDNLSEGTSNLYYTTSRVTGAISLTTSAASGGGSLSYSNGAFTFAPANLSSFLTSISAATSSAVGGLKLFSSAEQTVAANSVTTTSSRSYGLQVDSNGKGVVNVPWQNTVYTLPTATSAALGGIKIGYTQDGKKYPVELSSGQAFVNVPWSDTPPIVYTAAGGVAPTNAAGIYKATNEFKLSSVIQPNVSQTFGNSEGTGINCRPVSATDPANVGIPAAELGCLSFYNSYSENMRLEVSGGTPGVGVGLEVNGDITAFSTTLSSDIKLKENVVVVNGALEKVSKLNGVTFDWKKDGKSSAGVIAQNVEEVMPELVGEATGLSDTEAHKVVDYNGLSALFIEAIKELKDQNELLKAEIEELKANK